MHAPGLLRLDWNSELFLRINCGMKIPQEYLNLKKYLKRELKQSWKKVDVNPQKVSLSNPMKFNSEDEVNY